MPVLQMREPFDTQQSHRESSDTEKDRQARIVKRKALFTEIDTLPKMDIPEDFPSIVDLIHEGRDEWNRCNIKMISDDR